MKASEFILKIFEECSISSSLAQMEECGGIYRDGTIYRQKGLRELASQYSNSVRSESRYKGHCSIWQPYIHVRKV